MIDELDARVRALEAERARPDPGEEPTVEELMRRLIHVIATGLRTPPDERKPHE